ncbi:hypothetical protein N7462_007581 [Penicillium macrosclerotiorum]|uniref:uncharacterized protein n=1 Tax=Penicillium macrosclerotiorum TaxID=303699 RepID=UPI002546E9AB|nr:uncharacterized protein N7462_007581 [Penicillium macrosclerotiorum]KAJ5679337.1 hypothetical protein N7462_007581 [Penicillium macrosclerotiorum]
MLLNLGLTADAAAAHINEPCAQPESPPASNAYAGFSLPTLPFLDTFYNRARATTDPVPSSTLTGSESRGTMSPVASSPTQGESSTQGIPPALARPKANRSYSSSKKSTRPKTSYQLAHPAHHARHKRLKMRPKLLLQLQQVSQTPRPLPILDILPSTLYLPRLARKFPAMFRQRNGLGPNDLIIVMSELYERTVASIPEKQASSEDDDEDQREVVATICQMLHEDARSKGKAEICLNFGPVWEATPLPSGSYEFVARFENGVVQVMRWALRGGRSRRVSAPPVPGSQSQEDNKRFTFSVIDPNTRRHPVIASMTKNQLEINDEYSAVARSSTGPTTPSSGMSVASDMSDTEAPVDTNDTVKLDDGLRTLIIVTGIWVAFREGWSHNFNYGDPISAPNVKTVVSPTPSRYASPISIKNENENAVDRDELSPVKELPNGGKRCMSITSMRRSNTITPAEGANSFGSLSKRSNSTGAAFMDRAKRRTASGISNRLNRHSMLPNTGENRRDIVVSRPPSLRQASVEPEPSSHQPDRSKFSKSEAQPAAATSGSVLNADRTPDFSLDGASDQLSKDSDVKQKRRHRLSSIFTIFHRKSGTH